MSNYNCPLFRSKNPILLIQSCEMFQLHRTEVFFSRVIYGYFSIVQMIELLHIKLITITLQFLSQHCMMIHNRNIVLWAMGFWFILNQTLMVKKSHLNNYATQISPTILPKLNDITQQKYNSMVSQEKKLAALLSFVLLSEDTENLNFSFPTLGIKYDFHYNL